jgi:hypothetical protein
MRLLREFDGLFIPAAILPPIVNAVVPAGIGTLPLLMFRSAMLARDRVARTNLVFVRVPAAFEAVVMAGIPAFVLFPRLGGGVALSLSPDVVPAAFPRATGSVPVAPRAGNVTFMVVFAFLDRYAKM